jgi:hypothetical protein
MGQSDVALCRDGSVLVLAGDWGVSVLQAGVASGGKCKVPVNHTDFIRTLNNSVEIMCYNVHNQRDDDEDR